MQYTILSVIERRILDSFRLGFQFEDVRIELAASIGIATQPSSGKSPSQLIEAADRAMHKAKQSGGAGIEFA